MTTTEDPASSIAPIGPVALPTLDEQRSRRREELLLLLGRARAAHRARRRLRMAGLTEPLVPPDRRET